MRTWHIVNVFRLRFSFPIILVNGIFPVFKTPKLSKFSKCYTQVRYRFANLEPRPTRFAFAGLTEKCTLVQ